MEILVLDNPRIVRERSGHPFDINDKRVYCIFNKDFTP